MGHQPILYPNFSENEENWTKKESTRPKFKYVDPPPAVEFF